LERLKELNLISDSTRTVKLLGDGSLTKRVTVVVHQTSESAKTKVLKAGGSVELIEDRGTARGSRLAAQG
jgi:large subunit ribosomal protein L15